MHDRAARPTGAVKSAAAIAIEIMILLNIDLRIAHVRPRVEESVQRFPVFSSFCSGRAPRSCLRLGVSDVLGRCLQRPFWSIAKAFEVATNMLVVIMESSENHL